MSLTTLGPAGGLGGHEFENYTVPSGYRIKEVHIFASSVVNAIQFATINGDHSTNYLPKIGGLGGEHFVFALDKDEYITGVSGRCGWYIDHLRIHTNRRVSPAYGGHGGEQDFYLSAPAGMQVIGLFGRADWFLDAVGLMADELPTAKAAPAKKAAPANKTPVQSGKASSKDLQKVEGIGPKISELLIAGGVPDLAALSQTPVSRLEEILSAAGKRYRLADPTTWPEQAALGAADDWDGLAALQDELKGGRR